MGGVANGALAGATEAEEAELEGSVVGTVEGTSASGVVVDGGTAEGGVEGEVEGLAPEGAADIEAGGQGVFLVGQ